jgi:oxygen-independent coproporphyrinogen-3 oxidase
LTEVAPPAELVAKYRTRAPRYTSYPTAPRFGPLDAADVDRAAAAGQGPLSLYVHIPFCQERCLYCGCHVEIQRRKDVSGPYVDDLLREADLWAARLRGGRPLGQLALGGGTPTFLPPEEMARLVRGLRARWPFAPDADVAVEVDPRKVDGAYLDLLVDLGFRRFSYGVQDLDPTVLAAVHRPQPAELVRARLEHLRRAGAVAINIDLIYGLPHQTPEGFSATVAEVARMRPTRIALFHYAHVPWMKPSQKALERLGLPDSDAKARMFDAALRGFGQEGYRRIGMDHFALPGDALLAAQEAGTLQRNFEGYTTHDGLDQLGIGISAIGYFGGVYAQDLKDRKAWSARIADAVLPIDRGFVLAAEDRLRRRVIMGLFCNFQVEISTEEAGVLAGSLRRLAPLEADGLVVVTADAVRVTPLGRQFIRNVCAAFDAYLEEEGERRYSETA